MCYVCLFPRGRTCTSHGTAAELRERHEREQAQAQASQESFAESTWLRSMQNGNGCE